MQFPGQEPASNGPRLPHRSGYVDLCNDPICLIKPSKYGENIFEIF